MNYFILPEYLYQFLPQNKMFFIKDMFLIKDFFPLNCLERHLSLKLGIFVLANYHNRLPVQGISV